MPFTPDSHAWLRPYFAELRKRPAFAQYAPSHQFERLCELVAEVHPHKAAHMRQWSIAAQYAVLSRLAGYAEQEAGETMELWRVSKKARELRCVVRHLPTGLDVRLFEGEDFRRTQLCRDAPQVAALANEWRTALLDRGWHR